MKPWTLTLLLFHVLTTAAYGHQKTSDLYDIKISKVKDGIYLASRPEPLRPFVEGNVTIIINEHDVVLVDAGGAPSSARVDLSEVEKQFAGDDPVYRYYFQEYFATPNVERTFKELKTKTTTQSSNVDAASQIQLLLEYF